MPAVQEKALLHGQLTLYHAALCYIADCLY